MEQPVNLTRISKKLSFLLRHCTDPLLVSLDGGWADVDAVIRVLRTKWPSFGRRELEQIVAEDEKGRYSFDPAGKRIRANQGHSIPGVRVEMERIAPPEVLYHGTARRFVSQILTQGLRPMSRQYVHLSPDIPTALKVGRRHGNPVVLEVDAGRFAADGHTLLRSANGVWQAETVPPEYLRLLDAESS